MSALFSAVDLAPSDPILGLNEQFNADNNPNKVNLGVGVYFDDSGKMPLLQCVSKAQRQIVEQSTPYNYLPINGLTSYNQAVKELVFGAGSEVITSGKVVTVQGLGGTGALRIGADFLKQINKTKQVLISNPSWVNHKAIFTSVGFEVNSYPYYDAVSKGINFAGMVESLNSASAGTIVVLHACCHNPTGYDLTSEQWQQIIEICKLKQLVPFLDMAYQGFGFGIDEDVKAVQKFAQSGLNFFISTSFSKSLGLYGQRVGALSVVCDDKQQAEKILSQLKVVIRTTYSNPPTFGAAVATRVLTDSVLRQLWEQELSQMRERIKMMRSQLVQGLQASGVTQDVSFINTQLGMFSYSGLTQEQMLRLRQEFGIYGTNDGRICISALNSNNLAYVSDAIAKVLK